MTKDFKPASREQLSTLRKNMGELISSIFPLLVDCINTYNALQKVTDRNEIVILWEDLLRLQYFVYFSMIDLSASLRADLETEIIIEKRIHLKYVNVSIVEIFKALFGFRGSKRQTLWTYFKKDIRLFEDVIDEEKINAIDSLVLQFENHYYPIKDYRRDFAIHYDFDAIKVYDYLVSISEKDEVDKVSNYIEILQSVSILVRDTTTKYKISLKILQSDDFGLQDNEISNIFHDKDGKMQFTASDVIHTYGKQLDTIARSYRLPKKIEKLLDIKIDVTELKDLKKTFNPILIILYIYLDVCATILAYLRSNYYIEKQLHLRHLNVIVYEGVKKIYGFSGSLSNNHLWKDYLYPILISLNKQDVVTKAEEVNCKLKCLSKLPLINNKDFRNLSVHILDKKRKDYIPKAIKELISLSPESEMKKALLLMELLPTVIYLSKEVFVYEGSLYNRRQQEKMEAMMAPFVHIKQIANDEQTKKKYLIVSLMI